MVTFPFLFGVMFGDVGHGLCVLIFSLFICFKKSSFPVVIQEIRYLLLMMGFCSFYCGFIYNDFFSLALPIFKTCFDFTGQTPKVQCVYPIGLDYSWSESINKVSFTNSFKMKLSIVFGVTHMMIGIFNKGLNALYFNDFASFAFEFIP